MYTLGTTIPPKQLEAFAEKRQATSFSYGLDVNKLAIVMKFGMEDGTAQTLIFNGNQAKHIAATVSDGMRRFSWRNKYNPDASKMPAAIRRFLNDGPKIEANDWSGTGADGELHAAMGLQIDTSRSAFLITAWLSKDIITVIKLQPDQAVLVARAIAGSMEAGDLLTAEELMQSARLKR
ncbi:hypothetical protein ACFSM5_01030 [Lacibacterium aquatile]|uniref:Uncharacterized protein n=1 Tax=Lacibacterium aquatile TaxID=1168082 RepID=A0ABW5DND6_9PROT